MTTPTADAVPSSAPQDLLFNAGLLDWIVNGSGTVPDRLGVQRQTLAAALQTLTAYNVRGAWATGATYALKDVATSGGIAYVCLLAHTAGTFATDLAAGRWGVLQGVTTADLASSAAGKGAALVGFLQAGAGAASKTLQDKGREFVTVADYLTTSTPTAAQATAALQAAINSGAKKVRVVADYTINAPVNLAANQVLDFAGGSLTVAAGTTATKGVLTGLSKAGVKIVDPAIDASATSGITGIWLEDCPKAQVIDGALTKCCLVLWAASNATRMGYIVRGTQIDMAGWQSTGLFVKFVNGATISGVHVWSGIEGIGIYGDSRHVRHSDCEAWGHTRDGFVVIKGQRISYSGCIGRNNTQSGFCTQRYDSGEDARFISYSGCHAYENAADGFDVRGATDAHGAWGVNMAVTLSSCVAYNNTMTGFVAVLAEGTTFAGCVASNNGLQGFFVNASERAQFTGCRSASNAASAAAGADKAGFLIQNSRYAQLIGCESANSAGATQQYGASFTGTSADGSIVGGNYENNTTAPLQLTAAGGCAAYVSGAAAKTLVSVWTDSIAAGTNVHLESGNGVPTHSRPKASLFRRLDSGGSGEIYVSNGGGAWRLL